ncbi:LysR family transcriptional regulator [Qipengyuania sp. MTN3-11]|uniref:LysR family transcriptional regulator n=1 Tax=Qipengyuania sp. MTN3-11 TaxID=3056557 RepID=UPI0036F283A8
MIRPYLPLNGLRAFEAVARHLSFTHAATELHVTPAALSHQVRGLEERLGVQLFRRLPRGLSLTDEGVALLPVLSEGFDRIAVLIEHLTGERAGEVVTVGVVGTFAVAWLFPRLDAFARTHPGIELRISTNNNRVDLAEEGLDCAIRFGSGAWNSTNAVHLLAPPFTPLCAPAVAERLHAPVDVLSERLLRSYRVADWSIWFESVGIEAPTIGGPMFDSARLMVDAAVAGFGVALAPAAMFREQLSSGILVQPYDETVMLGAYYITWLKSQPLTGATKTFADWLVRETSASEA